MWGGICSGRWGPRSKAAFSGDAGPDDLRYSASTIIEGRTAMKARFLLLFLGATVWAGAARAEIVACPDQLAVQQSVTPTPAGWQSFDSQDAHPLAGVSLSEGHPSELATLVPTSDRKQGKVAVTTWSFIPSKDGYWLSCLYAGTSMAVTRKLPDGVKSCRVESDAQTNPPSPTKIECR